MRNRLLWLLLLGIILFRPVGTVIEQKEKFFSPGYERSYSSLKEKYNKSQYAKKKNPTIMSDDDFEQFAGGAFLKGLNPILIVHDHPPLGRYIVSLSILLFDNAHTIMLFVMALNILGLYLLSLTVLKDHFAALIPTGIFLNEPMFITRLIETPLPEPIQLPFILFAFYFFLKGLRSSKDIWWFIGTSLMIGVIISTRFFILGAAITGSMGLYLLLTHKLDRKTIHFLLTLPLSLVVLLLSYFRTIQLGASPLEIIRIQKYILAYHKSKFVLPFTVWDLLLFNRWHTWWGSRAVLSDAQWTILWPIATLSVFAMIVTAVLKKFKGFTDAEKVLMLWVTVHLTMLSTGYTSSRYFLSLLPILYILATAFVIKTAVHLFPRTFSFKPQKKAAK
jgi:hypothetical protein